jgi:hypothetical protein
VAVLHGLGTGSDAKTLWMLAITAGCVIVVIVAVVSRATAGWPQHAGARMTALAASVLVPVGLLAWLPSGPLAARWAQRAGTPASLLPKTTASVSAAVGSSAATSSAGSGAAGGGQTTTFTSTVSGTVHRAQVEGGLAEIHLSLSVPGQRLSTFGIRIYGHPVQGGGVQMTSSRVELGTSSNPRLYFGRVTGLEGTEVAAVVADPSGARLVLDARLQLSTSSNQAGGTLIVRPAGA